MQALVRYIKANNCLFTVVMKFLSHAVQIHSLPIYVVIYIPIRIKSQMVGEMAALSSPVHKLLLRVDTHAQASHTMRLPVSTNC